MKVLILITLLITLIAAKHLATKKEFVNKTKLRDLRDFLKHSSPKSKKNICAINKNGMFHERVLIEFIIKNRKSLDENKMDDLMIKNIEKYYGTLKMLVKHGKVEVYDMLKDWLKMGRLLNYLACE